MRFGEYVIQNGLLTHDYLLHALCIQRARQPHIAKLAVDQRLLTSKAALNLSELVEPEAEQFMKVARQQRQLSEDGIAQLRAEYQNAFGPIGMLLTELGMLSEEDRIHQLGKFRALHSKQN